jgi:predicted aspartyl protease
MCTLYDREYVIKSQELIDCGATGYAFIDKNYACCYNLPLLLLKLARNLTVINGQSVTLGATTHIVYT